MVEDLSRRSLRELLTLARERLGAAASGLKTKEELVAALTVEPEPPEPGSGVAQRGAPLAVSANPGSEVVTRDFFRRRT